MDKYDILEAMSGIRDEYIEDAAVFSDQAVHSEKQDTSRKNGGEEKTKRSKILRLQRWAATAAALLCVCVIAFTIRSSQSESTADSGEGMEGEAALASGSEDSDSLISKESDEAAAEMYVDRPEGGDISPAAAMSDAGVTGPVKQMTEEKVRVFEDSLVEETGYSSLRFTHEITTDSDTWFSLKMKAYTCAADGFEQVTHFNINRNSSEFVTLETLFSDDTDYITPLSEEVIRQMRERMASDPDTEFWLNSEEGPEYDFTEISPAQDFYFDTDGNLVLCFNEGEAAPPPAAGGRPV